MARIVLGVLLLLQIAGFLLALRLFFHASQARLRRIAVAYLVTLGMATALCALALALALTVG